MHILGQDTTQSQYLCITLERGLLLALLLFYYAYARRHRLYAYDVINARYIATRLYVPNCIYTPVLSIVDSRQSLVDSRG